jgi:hypothetical protein
MILVIDKNKFDTALAASQEHLGLRSRLSQIRRG